MGLGWANPRAPGLRGHPRVALHSSVPVQITLSKRALSTLFFHSLVAKSHNAAFHMNWWNQNCLGAPTTRVGGGGGLPKELHICRYGDVPPKWVDFIPPKSVNMGPILPPPQYPETWFKFVENRGKKITAKIFENGYIVWAKASKIAQQTWVVLFLFAIMS